MKSKYKNIFITDNQTVKKYRDSETLNQSSLKYLSKGFDFFMQEVNKIKPEESTKRHFIIGNAVDMLLTGTTEDFMKHFYIFDEEKKPSERVEKMLKECFIGIQQKNIRPFNDNKKYDTTLEGNKDIVSKVILEDNWYSNRTIDSNVKSLIKQGKDYYEQLFEAYGKTIISGEELTVINKVVENLENNYKTSYLFDRDTLSQNLYSNYYFQNPLYFKYEDINCKALPDMYEVKYSDKAKTNIDKIIITDVKTMSGNTLDFYSSVKKLRYDIQAMWYIIALRKHYDFKGQVIFQFVVESTTSPGKPLIYRLDEEFLDVALNGKENFIKEGVLLKREIKGIKQLIKEYKYYIRQGFKEDRRSYELQYVTLSIDGIK